MKKIFPVCIILILIISGCMNGSNDSSGRITLKGNFTGGTHAKMNWFDRIMSNILPSAYALDPDQVQKVMVFTGDCHSWFLSDIVDGSFSVKVKQNAVGLIFVGADNAFLGYLTLGNGIDSIPCQVFDEDENRIIDMGVLSTDSKIVEPQNNPIGDSIILTENEQKAIAQADNFFALIATNPDPDGDGKIDILEGKLNWVGITYFIRGGSFGEGALTPTVTTPADIDFWGMNISTNDTDVPGTIHFTGPDGSGMDCDSYAPINCNAGASGSYSLYGAQNISTPEYPVAGTYTITYDSTTVPSQAKTLTYSIPDQVDILNRIVIIVPTITLNTDGTINKISWTYKTGDGGEITNPGAILCGVKVQISGTGEPCGPNLGEGVIYDTGSFWPVDQNEYTFECSINWDDVTGLNMGYIDHYETNFSVSYSK